MICTKEEVEFLHELEAMRPEDREAVIALITGLADKDPSAEWALGLFNDGHIDAPMTLELMRPRPSQ